MDHEATEKEMKIAKIFLGLLVAAPFIFLWVSYVMGCDPDRTILPVFLTLIVIGAVFSTLIVAWISHG